MVIVVCTVFLYTILGWRYVSYLTHSRAMQLIHYISALLGILITLLGLPLPGRIAKYIQAVQREKMKKVRLFCPTFQMGN